MMKAFFAAAFLLTSVFWHLRAADIQVQDFRGKLTWGIVSQKVTPDVYPNLAEQHFESGQMLLKIVRMIPGAPEVEDLQVGDVILSINGQRADTFDIGAAPGSRGERLEPGDVLTLKVYQVRGETPRLLKSNASCQDILKPKKWRIWSRKEPQNLPTFHRCIRI